MDIVIQMPKYHTDIFWDLGRDISQSGHTEAFTLKNDRTEEGFKSLVLQSRAKNRNTIVGGQETESKEVEQESE